MRLKLAGFGLAFHKANSDYLGEDEEQHQRWCAPECLGIEFSLYRVILIHFNCFPNQDNFDDHVLVWGF